MQNELPRPVAFSLIAVAVVIVVGIGWFFLSRGPAKEPMDRQPGAGFSRPSIGTKAGGAAPNFRGSQAPQVLDE